MIKHSFTLRVLAISFIFLAIPLLIDSFIFFQKTYSESLEDVRSDMEEVADFYSITLSEIQPVKQILLKELIFILNLQDGLQNLSKEELNSELDEITELNGNFEIFVLEPELKKGEYQIFSTSWDDKRDGSFPASNQMQYILKKKGGTFLQYAYSPAKKSFVPYIFIARPIYSKDSNKTLGIIMVMSDIENELSSLIEQSSNLENYQIAIVNSDGIIFASSERSLKGNYFKPLSFEERKKIEESKELGEERVPDHPLSAIPGENPSFFEFIFNGELQIAYQTDYSLKDEGVSIIIYTAKKRFFASAIRHFLIIYTTFGFILIVGGGITYWFSTWISRPLRDLTFVMGEVNQGHLNKRFHEVRFGFEINMLGNIFNDTLDSLLDHIQKAENQKVQNMIYQRELRISREVQQSLLPQTSPELKKMEVSAKFIQGKEVGGEFYGWRVYEANGVEHFLFGIGDAPGSGIPASLYALGVRSLVRAYATLYKTLGEMLSHTNNAFLEDVGDQGIFATLAGGLFSSDSMTFNYYSCGHPPGFVKRAKGKIEMLAQSGIALGLKKAEKYQDDQIELTTGDIVLFYSASLLLLENKKSKKFGEDGIKHFLQSKNWTSAQEFIDDLAAEIERFSEGIARMNEIALLAMKIK